MSGINDKQVKQITEAFEFQLDVFNRFSTDEQKATMVSLLKKWMLTLGGVEENELECVRCEGTGQIPLSEDCEELKRECTLCKGKKKMTLDHMLQWIVASYEVGGTPPKQTMHEIIETLGKVGTVIEKPTEG